MLLVRNCVEKSGANDNWEHESGKYIGLDAELGCCVTTAQNDDYLQCTEWNVEQSGFVRGETRPLIVVEINQLIVEIAA